MYIVETVKQYSTAASMAHCITSYTAQANSTGIGVRCERLTVLSSCCLLSFLYYIFISLFRFSKSQINYDYKPEYYRCTL